MTRQQFKSAKAAVGLVYLVAAGYAVRLALDPRTYFFHTDAQRAAWRFPLPVVAFVCLLMPGEALVVLAALEGRPRWRRALLGAAALALWAVPSTVVGSIHAPGFLTWHAFWVWGLLAVLLVVAVGLLAAAAARRAARGRPARHAA